MFDSVGLCEVGGVFASSNLTSVPLSLSSPATLGDDGREKLAMELSSSGVGVENLLAAEIFSCPFMLLVSAGTWTALESKVATVNG